MFNLDDLDEAIALRVRLLEVRNVRRALSEPGQNDLRVGSVSPIDLADDEAKVVVDYLVTKVRDRFAAIGVTVPAETTGLDFADAP